MGEQAAVAAARDAELAKYHRAYENPKYRMKGERRLETVAYLRALPVRGSYLDVSCGRGDMMAEAQAAGFNYCRGTEAIPGLTDGVNIVLAMAHALPFPDKSFDVVTLFDVIEHLLPGDDELVCREMARVARRHVLITANNRPSVNKQGDDLHINIRPYQDWDRLFHIWFPGKILWVSRNARPVSECWRIDL